MPSLASASSSSSLIKREKSHDGMHDKSMLKAASRPKSKQSHKEKEHGDPARQGEREVLSTIEDSARPSELQAGAASRTTQNDQGDEALSLSV